MSISLIALQSFSGPDGKFAKDEPFEAPADRAKWLTENGYAERVTKAEAAEAAAVAGVEPAPAPTKRAPRKRAT